MNILQKLFSKNKLKEDKKNIINENVEQYSEIGNLLKQARIQKSLSIQELSSLSKIPEYIINSLENNIEQSRPEYPFMRSILLKLETCLSLKKNELIGLLVKDTKLVNNEKRKFIIRKFDLLNTWQGSVFYFLILILTLFILKTYFYSNVTIIEIQSIEKKEK